MRSAYIVTDIGFGDSGKGTTVDYLCQIHGPEAVVRYSGGAQASHTVVRGDLTHKFHSYGSGTLLGVPTYLSRYMIVDPLSIWQETETLNSLGLPGCASR
jgi:adenylosuccinate synthase